MLTDTRLRNAKPKQRPYKLTDAGGLYLFIGPRSLRNPEGLKSWRFDYRLHGKRETLTIGRYPDIGLAEARERHAAARKLVAKGESPAKSKQRDRAIAIETAANTFWALAEDWRRQVEASKSDAWKAQIARLLKKDIYPAIGDRPVRDVTSADVLKIVRSIADRGAAHSATVARQIVSRVYQFAICTLRAEYDPAQAVKGAIERPKPKHHPTLTAKELPAFMKAVEEYGGRPQTRLAIRLLLLTFTRKLELLNATWEELDLEAAEWRIPAGRMKMREEHVVPLSHQAVERFRDLRLFSGGSPFVFPNYSHGAQPMGEVTLNYAIRLMGYGGKMTPHGVRALASTILHEQGWKPDVIERQLAHAERNKSRAAYHRSEYLEERRRMMQAWADYLDALANGADVVALHRKA